MSLFSDIRNFHFHFVFYSDMKMRSTRGTTWRTTLWFWKRLVILFTGVKDFVLVFLY